MMSDKKNNVLKFTGGALRPQATALTSQLIDCVDDFASEHDIAYAEVLGCIEILKDYVKDSVNNSNGSD